MPLPSYDQNITLEEALSQFDYAKNQLVLHSLHEEIENPEARRTHVFEAARDAYLASSRWMGVLERDFRDKKSSYQEVEKNLARRYIMDVSSCIEVLRKIIGWYSRLEKRENTLLEKLSQEQDEKDKIEAQSKKLKEIRREKSLVANYVSLMGVMNEFAREALKNHQDMD